MSSSRRRHVVVASSSRRRRFVVVDIASASFGVTSFLHCLFDDSSCPHNSVIFARRDMCYTSAESSHQGFHFVCWHLRPPTKLWGRYDPKTKTEFFFSLQKIHFSFIRPKLDFFFSSSSRRRRVIVTSSSCRRRRIVVASSSLRRRVVVASASFRRYIVLALSLWRLFLSS